MQSFAKLTYTPEIIASIFSFYELDPASFRFVIKYVLGTTADKGASHKMLEAVSYYSVAARRLFAGSSHARSARNYLSIYGVADPLVDTIYSLDDERDEWCRKVTYLDVHGENKSSFEPIDNATFPHLNTFHVREWGHLPMFAEPMLGIKTLNIIEYLIEAGSIVASCRRYLPNLESLGIPYELFLELYSTEQDFLKTIKHLTICDVPSTRIVYWEGMTTLILYTSAGPTTPDTKFLFSRPPNTRYNIVRENPAIAAGLYEFGTREGPIQMYVNRFACDGTFIPDLVDIMPTENDNDYIIYETIEDAEPLIIAPTAAPTGPSFDIDFSRVESRTIDTLTVQSIRDNCSENIRSLVMPPYCLNMRSIGIYSKCDAFTPPIVCDEDGQHYPCLRNLSVSYESNYYNIMETGPQIRMVALHELESNDLVVSGPSITHFEARIYSDKFKVDCPRLLTAAVLMISAESEVKELDSYFSTPIIFTRMRCATLDDGCDYYWVGQVPMWGTTPPLCYYMEGEFGLFDARHGTA